MGKRKDKKQAEQLYATLLDLASPTKTSDPAATKVGVSTTAHEQVPITAEILASSAQLAPMLALEARRPRQLPKMKKFRFQLLHEWMIEHLEPCRVADIGGGKGLLAYLLQQHGWEVTVIDPVSQSLPSKYKDLVTGKQIHLNSTARVPRWTESFEPEMAQEFDLMVAMHAHGCNIKIIDAAAKLARSFILMPCCVIDEPLYPPHGVHWLPYLLDYTTHRGFEVMPFRLNFKGQNIGFYAHYRM